MLSFKESLNTPLNEAGNKPIILQKMPFTFSFYNDKNDNYNLMVQIIPTKSGDAGSIEYEDGLRDKVIADFIKYFEKKNKFDILFNRKASDRTGHLTFKIYPEDIINILSKNL